MPPFSRCYSYPASKCRSDSLFPIFSFNRSFCSCSYSRSTDFEVHRNWLAITSSLPLKKWYYEQTSIWTLDYPPLFAWFERLLGLFAPLFDERMLVISSTPYESYATVIFQRLTVILADCVFLYAVYKWIDHICFKSATFFHKVQLVSMFFEEEIIKSQYTDRTEYRYTSWQDLRTLLSVCFILNPALLLVDHIHFQYNGLLLGILLLSLLHVEKGNFITSAFLFAILLNMKHIYLYIAPAYFIYLLRRYTLDRHFNFSLTKFTQLALVVAGVFVLSFGPFYNQIPQVLSRLFPFKRGLTHSYWAPNVWAIYNTIDLLLAKVLRVGGKPGYTSGIVQEFDHLVLPSVRPLVPLVLSVLFMLPALLHLWRKTYFNPFCGLLFLRTVVICAYASFLFSWHVHEKAVLIVLLPMTPLVFYSPKDGSNFIILSASATASIVPLLPEPAEIPIYLLLSLAYFAYVLPIVTKMVHFQAGKGTKVALFDVWETLYLLGFGLLQLLVLVILPSTGISSKLPFLHLAMTSIYCSIGVIYTFYSSYRLLLSE